VSLLSYATELDAAFGSSATVPPFLEASRTNVGEEEDEIMNPFPIITGIAVLSGAYVFTGDIGSVIKALFAYSIFLLVCDRIADV